ncbi:hydroxymethylbilane synthase [Alicyclobacillus sp.]|uniref:hydroxymethylbilane synthase n=1 Tax=Alicyclobacillus sp. TaxID=61169 RepID=UPI0025BF0DFB|nr:hydroxymethylbilane synthase [Alicyclobacillus sp.]MCL6517740.1 hydroxymethylbilane synthase [Alicyclobacillus sp.]
METIRVASRQSALALRQTHWVMDRLAAAHPGLSLEVVRVVTRGDRILDVPLADIGGKGLFVSEVEACLLGGRADIAVHSLKDVPTLLSEGMVLGAVPVREDPRDALISRSGLRFSELPPGARVGTSSLRRVAQLKAVRPDLTFVPLRGNIDTRLRKLETEGLDAIVLAAAGLHRMGWADRITEYLEVDVCLPAMGQGLLGIECRAADARVRSLLQPLSDPHATLAARAERALLALLDGGCQVPMAGHARVVDEGVHLTGLVASPDGREVIRAEASGADPETVARSVADALRRQGADRLLELAAAARPGAPAVR